MTFKYWMMVERCPNLKEEVGSSIPGYEISSLLDINMALACRPLSQKKEKKRKLSLSRKLEKSVTLNTIVIVTWAVEKMTMAHTNRSTKLL